MWRAAVSGSAASRLSPDLREKLSPGDVIHLLQHSQLATPGRHRLLFHTPAAGPMLARARPAVFVARRRERGGHKKPPSRQRAGDVSACAFIGDAGDRVAPAPAPVSGLPFGLLLR